MVAGTRPSKRQRPHTHARVLLAGLLLLACLFAVQCYAPFPAHARPQEVTRAAKVRLLTHFSRVYHSAPQLMVLGSSRAMRADPAVLRRLIHVKAFNASVSSGTIPDSYAFLALDRHLYPGSRPTVLWFLDVEVLRLKGYHPYLRSVPKLRRWLPRLKTPAVTVSAQAAAGGSVNGGVVRPRWHPDGLLTYWWHDWQRSHGRTTAAAVRWHMGTYGSIYRGGYRRLSGSAKWFATQIVREANARGVTPVIVLTPYHPRLRSYLAGLGWTRAYRQVRRFLGRLGSRYDLKLIDLTYLASFGGWPDGFYDGVHPRAAMMRQMLRVIAHRAGALLRPAAPSPYGGRLKLAVATTSAGHEPVERLAAASLAWPPAAQRPHDGLGAAGRHNGDTAVFLSVVMCAACSLVLVTHWRRTGATGRSTF
jgi:hypothetical protein